MSRNANKIESIEQIKRRTLLHSPEDFAYNQMDELIRAAGTIPTDCLEIWKYFPVAAVTCLETSTRWAIDHLVEHGEDFRQRAAHLVTGQLTIKDLMPLIGRRITFGDLVSHLVSINNLQDITTHLSVLMGKDASGKQRDFLSELKAARTYDSTAFAPAEGHSIDADSLLLAAPDITIPAIKRVFEIRHIIVHELTPPDIAEPVAVRDLLKQVSRFLRALHCFILELATPGITAMYQSTMNMGACQRYETTEKEMTQLVDEVTQRLEAENMGQKKDELKEAQTRFMRFLDADARFYLNPFEGGSGGPMMDAGYRTGILQFRIDQLKEHLAYVIDPEAAYMGIPPSEKAEHEAID